MMDDGSWMDVCVVQGASLKFHHQATSKSARIGIHRILRFVPVSLEKQKRKKSYAEKSTVE